MGDRAANIVSIEPAIEADALGKGFQSLVRTGLKDAATGGAFHDDCPEGCWNLIMHLSSAWLLAIILEGWALTSPHPKKPPRKKTMRFQLLLAFLAALAAQAWFTGTATAVDAFVTATTGQPYGVATIEIPVEAPVVGQLFPPLQATDEAGRILYPISDDVRVAVAPASERPVPQPGRGRLLNRVGSLIRELANNDPKNLEQTVTRRVSFLFLGSEPLRVRLGDARSEIGTYDIVPQNNPGIHAENLRQWWSSYTDAAKRQIDVADYPAWVETYLVAMLSRRVHLPLPDWYTNTQQGDDELLSTLKLIAGAEGAGEAIFRRAASGHGGETPNASLPLPAPPTWAPMFAQDNLAGVPVEPLATRVPPECFYIRYGSFENYMWFLDLADEHGGDISRMMTLRGVENDTAARVEKQLNLSTTELSRMLGPTVIEDQAIIGRDMFLADGATIGVLFKAKNAFLLRTSLASDRSKLAREDDAVTLKDIKIAGRPISFLSSSDNQVRSFMAEDGDFFLVTNSRTMVERFFEVSETGKSLATTPAFQLSRQLMPLEREDTIFAYFSPAMLRGLVAPEYLIELRRRLHAKSDVAMVHLARLAAKQEPTVDPQLGIEQLVEAGFLPKGFGRRPDGSGAITVGDDVMDTLRGARGTLLPIADVKIDAVTAEEAAWYRQIASQYSLRFPTIDPIMVGVQRQTLEEAPGVERITIHAEVAPWGPEKYGKIAQQLGPPTRVAMEFAPDDIVAVQAHVESPQLGPADTLVCRDQRHGPATARRIRRDHQHLSIASRYSGLPGCLAATRRARSIAAWPRRWSAGWAGDESLDWRPVSIHRRSIQCLVVSARRAASEFAVPCCDRCRRHRTDSRTRWQPEWQPNRRLGQRATLRSSPGRERCRCELPEPAFSPIESRTRIGTQFRSADPGCESAMHVGR